MTHRLCFAECSSCAIIVRAASIDAPLSMRRRLGHLRQRRCSCLRRRQRDRRLAATHAGLYRARARQRLTGWSADDVTTGFAAIPASTSYRLTNARSPLCLIEGADLAADRDGLALVDLRVEDGRIASILPAGTEAPEGGPRLDLDGGIVLPRLVDAHVHLDKGHIWPRRRNPDGTFMGALENVMADREANWTSEDVRARMDFGLRCAFAHGTSAVRTHIDSLG